MPARHDAEHITIGTKATQVLEITETLLSLDSPFEPLTPAGARRWEPELCKIIFPDESIASFGGKAAVESATASRSYTPVAASLDSEPELAPLLGFVLAKRAFLRKLRASGSLSSPLGARIALDGLDDAAAPLFERLTVNKAAGLRHWLRGDLFLRAGTFDHARAEAEQAGVCWSRAGNTQGRGYARILEADAWAQAPSPLTWNLVPDEEHSGATVSCSQSDMEAAPVSATRYVRARAIYEETQHELHQHLSDDDRVRLMIRRASLEAAAANWHEAKILAREALDLADPVSSPLTAAMALYSVVVASACCHPDPRKQLVQLAQLAIERGYHTFLAGLALTFRSAGLLRTRASDAADVTEACFAAAKVLDEQLGLFRLADNAG